MSRLINAFVAASFAVDSMILKKILGPPADAAVK